MSVQIKTEDGWKKVAGNVDAKLIDDVNQRIDGYADRGYLTKSIIDTTSIKNVLNNNGAVRRGYDVKIPTSGKYYISIENNTGNTIDCGYCAEYGTASNLDNFTVTNGSKREIFKDLEKGNGFTLWNVVNSNVKITVALSEVALPYVPSNVELQSEIDATPTEYTITPSGNVTSSSYFKLLVKGKFAQLIADITYTTNATAYTVDLLGTLPSNIKPFGTTNLNFMGTYNLTDTALKSIIINPNNKTISAQCGQTNQSKRLFINLTFLIE